MINLKRLSRLLEGDTGQIHQVLAAMVLAERPSPAGATPLPSWRVAMPSGSVLNRALHPTAQAACAIPRQTRSS